MKILYNYEGAAIKELKNNEIENIIYVSLKEEKEKFSHYYNFFVKNEKENNGYIHIQNIESSNYYTKESINLPYIKSNNSNWERLDKEKFEIKNNEIIITISPKTELEISLVPRYTMKDLNKYIDKIKDNKNTKINNNIIQEIIIGDTTKKAIVIIGRQHPGETLSSFFIEGIINSILETQELIKMHCFIIYPIVNIEGVENGNHRYTNGIDYNRSWGNKNPPKEIKYIKKELKKYNIECFVDVHNDEITSMDYIRTSCKNMPTTIANMKVLINMGKVRRLVRSLIKQKKIINVFDKTAKQYISKKYKCESILIELSMNDNYKEVKNKGYEFIKIYGGKK